MKSSHQSLNNRLILGTVQLGLSYGINNIHGKPSVEEANTILDLAYQSGIHFLDTAEAYGDSQKIIASYLNKNPSKNFNILTKFKAQSDPSRIQDQIKAFQGLVRNEQLYCFSYHRFLDVEDERFKEKLMEMKSNKEILKVGVSVYDNEEFEKAIEEKHIDVIQLPFNLLDNWKRRGRLIAKAKSEGKEIHVRSVFLQGIFFKGNESFPDKLKPLVPYIEELRSLSREFEMGMQEMALNYALGFKEIDKVLVGVEKAEQLKQIVGSIEKPLCEKLATRISEIDVVDSGLVDPRKWA